MKVLELKIPPVIQVIFIAAGMWFFSAVTPELNASVSTGTFLAFLAVSISLIGIVISILGVLEFRKENTTVDPRFPEKSSQLVLGGIYRFSRNPMYLGFLLLLFGWSLYLMSYPAFLLLPVFISYMNQFQIKPEERFMIKKFGDEFKEYTERVRRWI